MKEPQTQIAITLYDLREHCQTESDLDRTLDRLNAIGFEAVQVSGTPLPAATIKRQLDKHNLFCCATHENLQTISGDPAILIDRLQTLECDFTALGMPPEEYRNSAEGIAKLIQIFNEQGAKLMEQGIRLGYHNHDCEFLRFPGMKKIMLETFYEETDPKHVYAELDLHWIVRGGGSPVSWIKKVAGRMPVVHFKDFALVGDCKPIFCEVGEGNLDWSGIIAACRETGVRWYSIEHDDPVLDRDIFDSAKISFDNLKAMGVK